MFSVVFENSYLVFSVIENETFCVIFILWNTCYDDNIFPRLIDKWRMEVLLISQTCLMQVFSILIKFKFEWRFTFGWDKKAVLSSYRNSSVDN